MFFHTLNTEKPQRENGFELFSDASQNFPACWHSHFAETTKRDHSETHLPGARSILFLQNVRSSVRMPLANSFSHLYSKFAFFHKKTWISIVFLHAKWIIFSPKCEKVGSIRHLPCFKISDSGPRWVGVATRERIDPPPDFKNPSNGSKRPYTHTHAANSYWRSLC